VSESREERAQAIAASEGVCPRCGTPREPDQRYCLECGLQLPATEGRIPTLRRSWIQRFGWYPGDWVWISLLTLLVAVLGAAVAIVLTENSKADGSVFHVPPPVVSSVSEPTTAPTATTAPSTVDTSTLPAAPEPTTTTSKPKPQPKNGRFAWPANENGWTIVLVSYPKSNGAPAAHATALRALHKGLPQVGVLDSSAYASLQPGYLVVFTGAYASRDAADAALATARQAGFAAAYVRQVAG
jgi:cell division septation protein DedD